MKLTQKILGSGLLSKAQKFFPPWQFHFPGYLYPPGQLVDLLEVCLESYFLFGTAVIESNEAGALLDAGAQLDWSKGRIYGVTREITSALWQTRPCPGMTISEIPMPMPTVFLTLPREMIPWRTWGDDEVRDILHEADETDQMAGSWVAYAMVTKFDPMDPVRAKRVSDFAWRTQQTKVSVRPQGVAPEHFYRIILVSDTGWMQRLQGDATSQMVQPMAENNTLSSAPITDDDQHMTGFVWNVIAAMSARPHLLFTGRVDQVRKKQHGKRVTVPLIYIPLFGVGYRVKSEPQGGHHASPTAHWRRGHFRNQPVGPKRQERKMIWLEPCLVAPKGRVNDA